MARPTWKGHISFGLVNIPITLYTAEQRTDLKFNMLDSRNRARVRYQRVNEVTGEEVPWNEIVKGFEYEDGSYSGPAPGQTARRGHPRGAPAPGWPSGFSELPEVRYAEGCQPAN